VLDICCTAPKHHRRGAGKMLVEWGTRKADELGIKCVVEASYPGRRLYEGCGFEIVEDVKLDGGKVKEEWKDYGVVGYGWMERKPRRLAGKEL